MLKVRAFSDPVIFSVAKFTVYRYGDIYFLLNLSLFF